MRLAPVLLILLGTTVAGCPSAPYGDAGAETGTVQEQTFDVGTSTNEICPGALFNAASQNAAVCTHAPETCFSDQADAALSRVQCDCVAAGDAGGSGRWTCFEAH